MIEEAAPSRHATYIFVSYSHRDSRRVTQEIRLLRQAGVNVWVDEEIRAGRRWRVEIANAIENCATFLFFATPDAVASTTCAHEVSYASEHNKPILQVQLKETDLPTEFRFCLSGHQAIHAWDLPRDLVHEQILEALQAAMRQEPFVGSGIGHHGAAHSFRKRGLVSALAIVVATFGVAGFWYFEPIPSQSAISEQSRLDPRSVAVMRFASIGGNRRLSDGLSEEMLHRLTGMSEIAVPSRTSTWALDGSAIGSREIAQRLGVRYILEGSVHQVGERFRVTAQLIDGLTDKHIWSETYDERLDAENFFEVQDDIASKLVEHLSLTLSERSRRLLVHRPTDDTEALHAYLRAREWRRHPNTKEAIEAAVSAYQQAIAADPQFADAHAGLCETYLAWYGVHRVQARFEKARNHCLEAARIDEGSAMVHLALGTLYRYEGRLDQAEIELDKAHSAEPDNVAIMEEMGRLLRTRGRHNEAEAVFEKAIRIEPGNWSVYKSMGNFLFRSGRYEEATAMYRQALRLDPGNPVAKANLATSQHMAGNFPAAAEAWSEVAEERPSYYAFINVANARFYAGRIDEAISWYSKAIELTSDDYRAYGGRAACFEHANEPERAQADYKRAAQLAADVADQNRADVMAISRLAYYQAKLGLDGQAWANLDRVDKLEEIDPSSHFIVALALMELGAVAQAEQALAGAKDSGFPETLVSADPMVQRFRARHQSKLDSSETTNNKKRGES